jgi:hypothetical protein
MILGRGHRPVLRHTNVLSLLLLLLLPPECVRLPLLSLSAPYSRSLIVSVILLLQRATSGAAKVRAFFSSPRVAHLASPVTPLIKVVRVCDRCSPVDLLTLASDSR